VGVQAAGLGNAGSVAAALAPGAQSMVNSLIGTWRQRTGVQVDKGTTGLSPWLRMFNDRGDIHADHVASNFGQAGEFGFDEANSGWELGLDARPWDQVHVGALLGESDGNQRLSGVGSGDIGGQTFGVYGTWIGDNGYYVDASFRWTGLTARLRADGMQQYTDGEADSFNVEAGFGAWSLPGNVLVQPQVQYTHTSLDLHPLVADLTTFDAKSATSSRGRVGVLFSKTIANDGWTWLPYGSVSAVREFDGEYAYSINDDFAGTTSTKGTSALVELGLGMHKDKVTVTGGLNWTDGGALSSFFGGQLVLRYTL
jgi:outer membrane autotransporter protein